MNDYGYLYKDGTGAPRRTPQPYQEPKHTTFRTTSRKLLGTWENPYVEPKKKAKLDDATLDLMEQFYKAMDAGDLDEMGRIMSKQREKKNRE